MAAQMILPRGCTQLKHQRRAGALVHSQVCLRPARPLARTHATGVEQVSVTTKSADATTTSTEEVAVDTTSSASATSWQSWDEMQELIRVGFLAEQGLRPGMEDELHVELDSANGCLYAAVFDGHGGPAAATWLRQNLMGMLSSHLANTTTDAANSQHVASQLAPAFQAVDDKLLEHLESLGGEDMEHAGATATVVLLWKHRVVVGNVGDSQAYLWRKSKEVSLTVPHRVYGLDPEVEEEIERVEKTGGWVYDGRVCNVLAVSRAFGDWEFKGKGLPQLLTAGVDRGYWPASFIRSIKFTSDPVIVTPDVCDMELTEDDEFLVLSSDGLWDVMPPRDVMMWTRKELQKGLTPQQVADSLVKLALKRHTSDNTSVVVMDLKGADYWRPKKKQGGGLFGMFGGQ